MDGVLNVSKPAGPTSHDVVESVRRLAGQKRVGHAGTLDPMATGVLLVCLGRATRIVEYLVGRPKEYVAAMMLGRSTDTQDSTGTVISESCAAAISRKQFEDAAVEFVGEIAQVPPMVSALKRDGRRLYELAREGKSIERAPRKVTVYSLEVLEYWPGERAGARVRVRCSSGTYIRTLCSDIGDALGCGAMMTALERTAVGRFRIEDSLTLEALSAAAEAGALADAAVGLDEALSEMPAVTIPQWREEAVASGLESWTETEQEVGSSVRILGEAGTLLGIGMIGDNAGGKVLRPRKVLVDRRGGQWT